jgi:hypothetical protein
LTSEAAAATTPPCCRTMSTLSLWGHILTFDTWPPGGWCPLHGEAIALRVSGWLVSRDRAWQ